MTGAQPPAVDDKPRPFGDYHLLSVLARGGMGSIHLAKRLGFRPDIQRFCVVKKLANERARPEFLRRFHDEARVVVTLNHRAICHVFDVGIVDGEHYLAMELIEGINLRALQDALASAQQGMAPAIALYILDEMLEALDYAHDLRDPATGAPLSIVHRDVSPQNVMLSFQGGVKVIDFGLVASSVKSEHTVGGLVVGKLHYMSPEQARGEAPDRRADVYAAAIVLTELLTGRRFYGDLSKSALAMHLSDGTFRPLLDGVPAVLRAPLAHALTPEREDRTPTCAAFQQELRAAGLRHGTARDLRALIEERLPAEKSLLEARVRSYHDVVAPPAQDDAVAQGGGTVVTHLARSSVSEETATLSRAPARTRFRPDRSAVAVVSVVVCGLLASALWFATRPTAAAAAVPVVPVVAVDAGDAHAAGDATDRNEGEDDDHHDGQGHPARDDPPLPEGADVPRPLKHPRPPATPLPDLGAAFTYLARYCSGRAPSCTQALLAQRGRVALLDAAGLRALRKEADACVLRCRR